MKKQHTWLVIPAAMLVLALTGCGSTKIDLMEYAAVSFDGINGQGTATCHVDTVSLEQDLAGNDDGEISADELEELGWITQFERTLSCQMDKETGLSNGDTVTVSVTRDEDFAKKHKINATEGSKEYTVEGLNSYVSSLSQLQEEDRQAVEDKLSESFQTEITGYVDYTAADGYSMDLIDGRTGSGENFALAQDRYTCYRPEMAIIPFTVDVTLETDWWNREYFEDGIIKNFPNSYGCFTVTGLEPDAEGKLMNLDPVQTAVYQPVLDEYAEAIGQGQEMPGQYPDVNELMVRLYYSDGQTEGFYYDFRDLDGNGTAEMLVAYGEQTKRICGVYGGAGADALQAH